MFGELHVPFRWKIFVIFSFSASQCCVPISVFLLGVRKGVGCALMVHTAAAPGCEGPAGRSRLPFMSGTERGKEQQSSPGFGRERQEKSSTKRSSRRVNESQRCLF